MTNERTKELTCYSCGKPTVSKMAIHPECWEKLKTNISPSVAKKTIESITLDELYYNNKLKIFISFPDDMTNMDSALLCLEKLDLTRRYMLLLQRICNENTSVDSSMDNRSNNNSMSLSDFLTQLRQLRQYFQEQANQRVFSDGEREFAEELFGYNCGPLLSGVQPQSKSNKPEGASEGNTPDTPDTDKGLLPDTLIPEEEPEEPEEPEEEEDGDTWEVERENHI